MGQTMEGVTKAMGWINRQRNVPSLQTTMQEFRGRMTWWSSQVKWWDINDALKGGWGRGRNRRACDQVLDDIRIDVNQEVCSLPSPYALLFHFFIFMELLCFKKGCINLNLGRYFVVQSLALMIETNLFLFPVCSMWMPHLWQWLQLLQRTKMLKLKWLEMVMGELIKTRRQGWTTWEEWIIVLL